MYGLPSLLELLQSTVTKTHWYTLCHKAVHNHWDDLLKGQASKLSSLRFVNIEKCSTSKPHIVWKGIKCAREARRAIIRARLLTGSFTLQGNRARFNQYQVNATCIICKTAAEDRKHFMLECPALETVRTRFMPLILHASQLQDRTRSVHEVQDLLDTSHLN